MSDTSPYGITHHADSEHVTANALVGGRSDMMPVNAIGSPAMFSTAPYVPDGRSKNRVGKCLGRNDHCQVGVIKGTDRCWFHTPYHERPSQKVESEPAEPA